MKRAGILLGFICLVLTYFSIQTRVVSPADIKYPTKPIKFIVPFSAGGPLDIIARKLANLAEPYLGQEVIVENKPGGGTLVGVRFVVKSKPDGYTICFLTPSPVVIGPHFTDVDYDISTDFTPIIHFAYGDQPVIVRADSSIKTFNDFMEEAQKREVTVAGQGMATPAIAIMRLAAIAKVKLKIVPFEGAGPSLTALLGGQTDGAVGSGFYEYVRSGKVRLIFLTTGMKNKEFPEIPTLRELGYPIEVSQFNGIIGPKNLPEQIQKKLEAAFTRAIRDPSFTPALNNASYEFVYKNSEDFGKLIKEEYKRAEKELRELGLGKYAKEKK